MEKTKKVVSLIIIMIACLVLIFGIIDSSIKYSSLTRYPVKMTPSYYSNSLDKDGKIMTTGDVPFDEEYLYVKTTKVEVITQNEYLKRVVKNKKIIMEHVKEEYDAEVQVWISETLELNYNTAVANYNFAKKDLSRTNREAFSLISTMFFSTYFTIIAFLGIAFVINQKLLSSKGEVFTKSNDKSEI